MALTAPPQDTLDLSLRARSQYAATSRYLQAN